MLKINVVSVGRGTRGHVLASCKVELRSEDDNDVVSVYDARVLRNGDGKLWVGFHTQSCPTPDGRIGYLPTIEFSKDLKRRISERVLDAYNGPSGSKLRVEAYEG